MFILRQINSEEIISNMAIGDRYIVTRKDRNPKRFEESLENTGTHPDQEKVFALLSYTKGDFQESYPLYKGQYYYIMTPSGQTFESIKP